MVSKGTHYPPEYIEMKFCQQFHISPREYARLPRHKIDLFLSMIGIEEQLGKQNG